MIWVLQQRKEEVLRAQERIWFEAARARPGGMPTCTVDEEVVHY